MGGAAVTTKCMRATSTIEGVGPFEIGEPPPEVTRVAAGEVEVEAAPHVRRGESSPYMNRLMTRLFAREGHF